MTPEEIGARVAAFLLGAGGMLGARRLKRGRDEGRNDPEHPIFASVEDLHDATERLTVLETDFKNLERRMEDRDKQSDRERSEIMAAIKEMGGRLEGKVDALWKLVYERRAEPRS